MTVTTETTCHCGAAFNGSDHCPECGCEQYEANCDHDINEIIVRWDDERKWRAVRAGKGGVRVECHTSDEDCDQALFAMNMKDNTVVWEFMGGYLDDTQIPRDVWTAIWKDALGFVPGSQRGFM